MCALHVVPKIDRIVLALLRACASLDGIYFRTVVVLVAQHVKDPESDRFLRRVIFRGSTNSDRSPTASLPLFILSLRRQNSPQETSTLAVWSPAVLERRRPRRRLRLRRT